jgi:hypothetical protein
MYCQKVISKKLREKNNFFVDVLKVTDEIARSGSISQRYGSADPDPYQNFMDPQHCFENLVSNLCLKQ